MFALSLLPQKIPSIRKILISLFPPTGADFLVVLVLLWMAGQAALETILPELREPGVPGIGVQTQLQVIVIKGFDHLRLQLHGDSSLCFLLIALHNLVTVCPSITTGAREKEEEAMI